jgi:hypothetical protein
MTGCGSLAHIVHNNFLTASDDRSAGDMTPGDRSGTIRVYNNNPYTVHLEIEETDSQREMEPINGDGGASLNAYAACLTLKVIF